MGFKKGRAVRAAAKAQVAADQAADENRAAESAYNIRHDGGKCVTYVASNGSEYRINVETMEQDNLKKGTHRAVYRRRGHGKLSSLWTMWQYDAGMNSKRCYVQYPKWVGWALEERWKAVQDERGDGSLTASAVAQWRRIVLDFDDETLTRAITLLSAASSGTTMSAGQQNVEQLAGESHHLPPDVDTSANEDADELTGLVQKSLHDEPLRQVLAERLLQASAWSPAVVVDALRCLLRCGLQPTASHCRSAALASGSLAVLRVLLVDADVDVCGLAIFESSSIKKGPADGKRGRQSEGSWVQRCKAPLRALMARGAVLGANAPPSKLLKKLEEDGEKLWNTRALQGFQRSHPEVPDCVLERITIFL